MALPPEGNWTLLASNAVSRFQAMEIRQGETVFYDRAGEPFHAVAPKPGRLLLFDGGIVHRGGVPSRKCFEPRLSVAFKFREEADT